MDYILLYLNKERNLMWSESFFLPKMRHSASFGVLSSCLYFSLLVFTKQISLSSICNTNPSVSSTRGWSVETVQMPQTKRPKCPSRKSSKFFWEWEKRKQQKKLECDCVNKCYKSFANILMNQYHSCLNFKEPFMQKILYYIYLIVI